VLSSQSCDGLKAVAYTAQGTVFRPSRTS